MAQNSGDLFSHSLEAKDQRSRWGRAMLPAEALGQDSPCLFQSPGAPGRWSCPSDLGLFLCVCASSPLLEGLQSLDDLFLSPFTWQGLDTCLGGPKCTHHTSFPTTSFHTHLSIWSLNLRSPDQRVSGVLAEISESKYATVCLWEHSLREHGPLG